VTGSFLHHPRSVVSRFVLGSAVNGRDKWVRLFGIHLRIL
jgi:hypothetical protein